MPQETADVQMGGVPPLEQPGMQAQAPAGGAYVYPAGAQQPGGHPYSVPAHNQPHAYGAPPVYNQPYPYGVPQQPGVPYYSSQAYLPTGVPQQPGVPTPYPYIPAYNPQVYAQAGVPPVMPVPHNKTPGRYVAAGVLQIVLASLWLLVLTFFAGMVLLVWLLAPVARIPDFFWAFVGLIAFFTSMLVAGARCCEGKGLVWTAVVLVISAALLGGDYYYYMFFNPLLVGLVGCVFLAFILRVIPKKKATTEPPAGGGNPS